MLTILTLDKLILSIICGPCWSLSGARAHLSLTLFHGGRSPRRLPADPARLPQQRPDGGAALGVALWGAFSVIAIPILERQKPQWMTQLAGLQPLFPALVSWVLYGALLATLTGVERRDAGATRSGTSTARAAIPARPARRPSSAAASPKTATAEHLEQEFRADQGVAITLVSNTNALLFTPMLAEVASSSLEATHITTPLLPASLHAKSCAARRRCGSTWSGGRSSRNRTT
ncbi:MAG: hypothetical protein U0841_18910 [Chloroflexia bacterium]